MSQSPLNNAPTFYNLCQHLIALCSSDPPWRGQVFQEITRANKKGEARGNWRSGQRFGGDWAEYSHAIKWRSGQRFGGDRAEYSHAIKQSSRRRDGTLRSGRLI